ncbi:hypothetical protein HAX54_032032 [Datura stramonium]|uniref:Ribulose bisphosphate carboxylase large chain n=1 Tax=Datura stramonium TaxID=4076 RepID=A0ABS8VA43_DATST|nr:hypothetical protein [Datura stramonium]
MSPQIETKASVGFKTGVKEYKLTYYTPEYQTKDTDILATFRVTPQPGVPPKEAGAVVAAESSTGLPSNWHKQIGLLSNKPANAGQHSLSGLLKLLPCSTNVKQLDMFTNTVIQSDPPPPDVAGPVAGDITIDDGSAAVIGGIVCASANGVSIVENRVMRRRNVVVEAILIFCVFCYGKIV